MLKGRSTCQVQKSIPHLPSKMKKTKSISLITTDCAIKDKKKHQVNGMIFQKDWTPRMEHFILTLRHQECWHHLNFAVILPSASWAWFIFFTTSFYLCSDEILKVHKSTRTSCYFPEDFVKTPADTSSGREKLHDNLATKITTLTIDTFKNVAVQYGNWTSSILTWLLQSMAQKWSKWPF